MKKWSPAMMGIAAVGGLGLLYVLFNPKAASAASTPPVTPPATPPGTPCPGGAARNAKGECPQVQPTTQKCPDGSTIPITATCPKSSCPTHGHPAIPNTAPAPTITVLYSGEGAVLPALPIPLTSLSPGTAGAAAPCIQNPATDALVFLQAWEVTISGLKPIFTDPGPSPAVGIVVTEGGLTGLQKAKNQDVIFKSKDSYVSAYFDPKQTVDVARMESPGAFVLIWTTDVAGNPIAWWLTSWEPSVKMT